MGRAYSCCNIKLVVHHVTGRLWKVNHVPSGGECAAHRDYSRFLQHNLPETRHGLYEPSEAHVHLTLQHFVRYNSGGWLLKFHLQTGKQSKNYEKLSRRSFYYEQQNITQKTRDFSDTKNVEQWRTQEFCSGVGGSTNSVEDRGQKERGSGGSSPLVRGSEGSCNLVQEISFHTVKFS